MVLEQAGSRIRSPRAARKGGFYDNLNSRVAWPGARDFGTAIFRTSDLLTRFTCRFAHCYCLLPTNEPIKGLPGGLPLLKEFARFESWEMFSQWHGHFPVHKIRRQVKVPSKRHVVYNGWNSRPSRVATINPVLSSRMTLSGFVLCICPNTFVIAPSQSDKVV